MNERNRNAQQRSNSDNKLTRPLQPLIPAAFADNDLLSAAEQAYYMSSQLSSRGSRDARDSSPDLGYTESLAFTSGLGSFYGGSFSGPSASADPSGSGSSGSGPAFFSSGGASGGAGSGPQLLQDNSPPIVESTDLEVVSREILLGSEILKASDPDGDAIRGYRIRHKWPWPKNNNRGRFFLNGVEMDVNKGFYVKASDIDNLEYLAAPRGQRNNRLDKVLIRASDEHKAWSEVKPIIIRTLYNKTRPVVTPHHQEAVAGSSVDGADLFSFFDADGNTPKRYMFRDITGAANSAYFEFKGVKMDAGVWFRVKHSNLHLLKAVASLESSVDRFQIRAYDGRHWSKISTSVFNSLQRPVIDSKTTVVLNELERVTLSELFADDSSVPPIQKYEIMDRTDDGGGGAIFNGLNRLAANVVHTIDAADIFTYEFRGGNPDNRYRDRVLVRGFNGQFWGEWKEISVVTDPHYIGALESGLDWTQFLQLPEPGDPLVITFSFLPEVPDYYDPNAGERQTFARLPPEIHQRIRETLADLEGIINVDFLEVPDAEGGVLRFGSYNQNASPGTAYFPDNVLIDERGGDVWLNNAPGWFGVYADPTEGQTGATMLRVLIGRAMGLKFTAVGLPKLPLNTDNQRYATMAALPGGLPNWDGAHVDETGFFQRFSGSFQLYDVATLQKTYGANTNFATGDDIYTYPALSHSLETIVDAGGNDTIDLSNQATGVTLDLRQGAYSSFGEQYVVPFDETWYGDRNLAIAYGTEIENGIGSAFDDSITGNELDNTLSGGDGSDTINGLTGNDTLKGGAGADNYHTNLWGGYDTIDEEGNATIDTLFFNAHSPQFDSFEEDLAFRKDGNDLLMNLVMNKNGTRDLVEGQVRIKDMVGTNGVETLTALDVDGNNIFNDVDLTSVMAAATDQWQHFRLTGAAGTYGEIAAPV